jgi:mannose-6-phosphate isomerase-like protein (cupin superfamily)
MINTEYLKDYSEFVSTGEEKYCKSTLFENEAVLVGLNCFMDGQEMYKHAHAEQNRFYVILEGKGTFSLDDMEWPIQKGQVAFVPAGHSHRIRQTGDERLVVLVGIAPAHAD